ncbi:MAG: hypothetical protein P4L51_28610 [Puia sp.]|nr:hypothetical protein [Puia sp.]
MWLDGIYFSNPYQPGNIDRLGKLIGWLLGSIVPFLPQILVMIIVYSSIGKGTDPYLWKLFVVAGGAALIVLIEVLLLNILKFKQPGGTTILTTLFVLFCFVLHIWAVQAGVHFILKNSSQASFFSWLAALGYAVLTLVALSKRKADQ